MLATMGALGASTMLGATRIASASPAGATRAMGGRRGTSSAPVDSVAPAASAPTGTIRVGTYLDGMALDPHKTTQGQPVIQYLQPVYDTLVRRNADATFSPMLATEWTYLDDGRTTLQLILREGVTFIDGTPFDGDAVKANIERSKASTGTMAQYLADVDTVEVVDPTTVVLHLASPSPTIELGMSSPAGMMISPAAFANPDLDTNPVGTGPYTFDSGYFVASSRWGYDYRDDYWDPEFVGPARLELSLFTDAEARFNALRSDQIDISIGTFDQLPDAESSGLQVFEGDVDWRGLILADRDGTMTPALGDPRVRQALNHAVDRDAMLETVFGGHGVSTTQIWPATSPAYVAELDDAYSYDPDKARALLAEAGYADGFTIRTPSVASIQTGIEAIAGYLAEVGVTLEIETLESGFVAAVLSGEYDAPYMSFGVEHPHVDIANLLLPDAPFNPLHADDPEIAALRTSAAAKDPEAAAADYQAVNQRITENAWFLVTNRPGMVWFTSPKVSGFEIYALQAAPAIYGWQIEA